MKTAEEDVFGEIEIPIRIRLRRMRLIARTAGINMKSSIFAFFVNSILWTFEGSNSLYEDGISSDWEFFAKYVIGHLIWWVVLGLTSCWVMNNSELTDEEVDSMFPPFENNSN
jgi:hypothetical protein